MEWCATRFEFEVIGFCTDRSRLTRPGLDSELFFCPSEWKSREEPWFGGLESSLEAEREFGPEIVEESPDFKAALLLPELGDLC